MEYNKEDVSTLALKNDAIIKELKEIETFLRSQEVRTYRSKSAIQWRGGIIGAIQENREDKRLLNILNTPIYNGKSYVQLCAYITELTKQLVENQKLIQKATAPNDEIYYGGVENLYASVVDASMAWHDYSPEAAHAPMNDCGELMTYLKRCTDDEMRKLDLPESIKISEPKKETNSGCLGVIAFIIGSPALLYLISQVL